MQGLIALKTGKEPIRVGSFIEVEGFGYSLGSWYHDKRVCHVYFYALVESGSGPFTCTVKI